MNYVWKWSDSQEKLIQIFNTIWNFKKTMEMTWLHIDEPSAENNGAAVTAPIIFMTKS